MNAEQPKPTSAELRMLVRSVPQTGNVRAVADETEPGLPMLYLAKTWLFTWEQHEPGGCRCVCRM